MPKPFRSQVCPPVERRPDLHGIQRRRDAGSIELLLHRPEMPPLLLRQREQRNVFSREALDLPGGHDDGRAAVTALTAVMVAKCPCLMRAAATLAVVESFSLISMPVTDAIDPE
jgi:hypothetical protein